MAHDIKFSDFEKSQITAYQWDGRTNREIARLLGRSPTLLHNFVKDSAGYGTKKPTGRPNTIFDRNKRQIYRAASNSVKICSAIKKDLGLNVPPEWIRLIIQAIRTFSGAD